VVASLLPVPLAAQTPDQEFKEMFAQAVEELGKVEGDLTKRRNSANATLALLTLAESLVDRLEVDAKRKAQYHFFIGVRRAEVYLHLDTDIARPKSAEVGREIRRSAFKQNVYFTYYRAVLLITLSRTMPEHEFLAMLDDDLKDGEYLRGTASETDLKKMRKGYSNYTGYLSLLRAWIDLTRRPTRAVNQLRELGLELKQFEDKKELRDEVFSRLAWHFVELRDFDRAKLYLDEVTSEDSRYPRAVIDYRQGNFDFCAEEAAKLYRKDKLPECALLLADAKERLAQKARLDTDPAKAERLLSSALRYYGEAILGAKRRNDPQVLAAALNGQGDCYLALGKLDVAQRVFDEVLEMLRGKTSWTERAERAETLKDLGRLAERREVPVEALDYYSRALTEVEEIRKGIPLDALGIAWLEPGQLEAVDGVLRLALLGATGSPHALATIDRMKARGLLDWLRSPPSSKELLNYREALTDLAKARSAADVRYHRLKLDRWRSRDARQRVEALSEAAVMDLVGSFAGTTFLSFWTGKSLDRPRVYLVVAQGSTVDVLDLGDVRTGEQRYLDAVAAVRKPGGDPWPALDAATGFFLPASVRSRIAAGSAIVVCPDSEMGDLPIEAMRVDGKPLGVRNVVYRTPSIAVLSELTRRKPRLGRTLIFDSAEPSTDDRATHKLADLVFSEEEGDLVSSAHPDHVRKQRAQATYAQLRETLKQLDFCTLHVSCHAVSNPRIPSASLLMLSGDALDMGTLATLRMDNMLVVFSSCRTVGTERAGGEGVKGLLWGPLAAKARAVVASHWEMNQQATKDLMGQFHHHLAAGCDEGEAMRRARETLSNAANYAHPSYWAGFGVFAPPPATGANVATAKPEQNFLFYGVLGLGVLLLAFALWGLTRRKRKIDVPL